MPGPTRCLRGACLLSHYVTVPVCPYSVLRYANLDHIGVGYSKALWYRCANLAYLLDELRSGFPNWLLTTTSSADIMKACCVAFNCAHTIAAQRAIREGNAEQSGIGQACPARSLMVPWPRADAGLDQGQKGGGQGVWLAGLSRISVDRNRLLDSLSGAAILTRFR
jgi:hypothetical protein